MNGPEIEHKFSRFGELLTVQDGCTIQGYASLFGQADQGGDIVAAGAYRASLQGLSASGCRVKMLWQHDPSEPIGVWDEIHEDNRGLWVKGRLLTEVSRGAEAAALIAAGAIEGLSIGYRTKCARKREDGRRILTEVELWEVSLVTFPMLPTARVMDQKAEVEDRVLRRLAADLRRGSCALNHNRLTP